jgi:transcription elongation GreA/GreB family factor
MSRAFVNEDAPSFDELPDRIISEHPNDVTPEGLAQIEAQLADARRAYAAAQEADDRAAMASASRDVRYWNARRGTAHVMPPPDDNTHVRFGSAVTIVRSDGRQQTFRIVGEDEADPAHGTISHASPLAQSLFGKGVGDVVRAGSDDAEITEIR